MTRDDIIRLAREAGFIRVVAIEEGGAVTTTVAPIEELERFAALVAAAEREKVAAWMIERSYATGHGDTVEDLLKELEWQIKEREREACAKVCEGIRYSGYCPPEDGAAPDYYNSAAAECAATIRARGDA
jgi:hypothetical protein